MAASAVHVSGQGEDLAVGHMVTDNRIASAEVGWQGTSAAAMTAKLSAWSASSAVLLGLIRDHAQALQTCVVGSQPMRSRVK
jgi:hypothetical protein